MLFAGNSPCLQTEEVAGYRHGAAAETHAGAPEAWGNGSASAGHGLLCKKQAEGGLARWREYEYHDLVLI
jgi:hypothetical protein